jgi:cell division protein FtsQ
MSKKNQIIKKIAVMSLWIGLGVSMLILLVASTRHHSGMICKDVEVTIRSAGAGTYITQKEILDRVSGRYPELLKGTLLKNISLSQLEKLLEQHLWIREAELYFDNNNILQIDIQERLPVARVFSVSGETFYVDDFGFRLPVNGKQIAYVPVFTGFPAITYPLLPKDSLLLMQVKDMGIYMLKNDVWKAQIDQVNIQDDQMELIPKLGKHQILFGNGLDIERKFKRLMLFYKKVMKYTGWNYYSSLDLRYDKQIVAVRRDSASLYASFTLPIDTIEISKELDSLRIARDTSLILHKDTSEPATKAGKLKETTKNN